METHSHVDLLDSVRRLAEVPRNLLLHHVSKHEALQRKQVAAQEGVRGVQLGPVYSCCNLHD